MHACRSRKRRDRIATVIAPQANSLLNWLGRRSGNYERSDSKGGIDNLMWCSIGIHPSSGVAQSLQSISSDGVCVGAETEDQLRQIGLFGQSEGSLKMYNIRCKSKEKTSFAGGVALSEEYINSEEDAGADTSRVADSYIWIFLYLRSGTADARQVIVNRGSALAAVRFYCFLVALRLREGVSIHIGSRSTTCHLRSTENIRIR